MPAEHGPVSPRAVTLARCWALRSSSRPHEAARQCREILARHAQCGEAWHLLGLLSLDGGDLRKAVEHLKRAVAEEPRQPLHYNNLAVVLNDMQRHEAASGYLQQALEIAPDYLDAKINLGLAYYHLGRLASAARCFTQILDCDAGHTAALANLGMTRLAQQDHRLAAEAYCGALARDDTRARWHGNLGAAYMRMDRFRDAAECYRQARERDPRNVDYRINLGIALRADGDLDGSVRALKSALAIDPAHPAAMANLAVALEYTCQWDRLAQIDPLLTQSTRAALDQGGASVEDPMLNIRRCGDPSLNRAVARAWSRTYEKRALQVMPPFPQVRSKRNRGPLTIGYLSYDFRNHPVAHQLHPLFSGHDRRRFRVIAFSMGPDDGSAFRRRIEAGCDEFVDIRGQDLARAAATIHDRQPDILVDLMGHSHHHRMEILWLRCAPLQVSYLGFLSTTGCEAIDYVVADGIVVPREHGRHYSEKLLRMPHCYQMNHAFRPTSADRGQLRRQWHLPESGFVFSCFNNSYKIDGRLFETWMAVLAKVPGSVLWLYAPHPTAAGHMQTAARKNGIDPRRLVFADKVPLPKHLERLVAADLALDTVRYNGGATTANALGAGLPVLTVMGGHWVSRMSASHLISAGLPDLVFEDLASYARAAVSLARRPDRLRSARQRLAARARNSPLFDPQVFVQHLEQGYELIWRRYRQGLEPCDIDIPDIGEPSS